MDWRTDSIGTDTMIAYIWSVKIQPDWGVPIGSRFSWQRERTHMQCKNTTGL